MEPEDRTADLLAISLEQAAAMHDLAARYCRENIALRDELRQSRDEATEARDRAGRLETELRMLRGTPLRRLWRRLRPARG
ncbi:hypothetical protein [Paracoccus sp. (in: a-proteobacteria)]|uniref:hypothetical protein n=1 Tax=Paracoccus sp. TaxID=267 RepID=UPI003A83C0DB